MKAHEILSIIKTLRENTEKLEEQIPILRQLTTCDVDKTGMVVLYCTLADIYYELEKHKEFVECCEDAKDNMSVLITNEYVLHYYKETVLKQAEYYVMYKEDLVSGVTTVQQVISFLQMHEAAYSEFFYVQEKFITLLDFYRGVQYVRYQVTWSNMSREEQQGINPIHIENDIENKRRDFIKNIESNSILSSTRKV